MNKEAILPPVRGNQQVPSVPLLRRPRPPRKPACQTYTSTTNSENTRSMADARMLFDSKLAEMKLRAISTPVHPLPRHHPTPLSPHRHSHTLQTITQHTTSQNPPIYEQTDDVGDPKSLESGFDNDIIIHPLYPRGPKFFPPGRRTRLKKHKPLPQNWWEGEDLNFHVISPHQNELCNDDFMVKYTELDAEETALYEAPIKLRGNTVSRQNYLKLTSWFATHVPQQDSLNTLDLSGTCHQTIDSGFFTKNTRSCIIFKR